MLKPHAKADFISCERVVTSIRRTITINSVMSVMNPLIFPSMAIFSVILLTATKTIAIKKMTLITLLKYSKAEFRTSKYSGKAILATVYKAVRAMPTFIRAIMNDVKDTPIYF